jgi:cell division protein FtsB
MLDVEKIVAMHNETVDLWHRERVANPYEGWMAIVCQQHQFNFQLWHQEDIARSPDVSDTEIAQVKRNIDKLNQQRNDWIERIDDYLTQFLEENEIVAPADARANSETAGSCVDRLSIMAIRIYHLQEQLDRDDVDDAHIARVGQRLAICKMQQRDLAQCLAELVDDIRSMRKKHRVYRQFKMYNDPTLNPYLYQRQARAAS